MTLFIDCNLGNLHNLRAGCAKLLRLAALEIEHAACAFLQLVVRQDQVGAVKCHVKQTAVVELSKMSETKQTKHAIAP